MDNADGYGSDNTVVVNYDDDGAVNDALAIDGNDENYPAAEFSDAELSDDQADHSDDQGDHEAAEDEDDASVNPYDNDDVVPVGSVENARQVLGFTGRGKEGCKRFKTRKLGAKGTANITKGDLRRLARRGGVVRMGKDCDEVVLDSLKSFLEKIIKDAIVYTEHGRRKTVSQMDIMYSLKKNGRQLYY